MAKALSLGVMAITMMVNGKTAKCLVMAHTRTPVVICMWVIMLHIKKRAMGSIPSPMEMSIKGCMSAIVSMGLGNLLTIVVMCMKACIAMTCVMAKESFHGMQLALNTFENTKMT